MPFPASHPALDRALEQRGYRVVALARVEGPAVALEQVDAIEGLAGRAHLWHAVRASLLRELGREPDALAEDLLALELTANEAERRLLADRAGR